MRTEQLVGSIFKNNRASFEQVEQLLQTMGLAHLTRTHTKSMSLDPHWDRLFLSLQFSQLNIFLIHLSGSACLFQRFPHHSNDDYVRFSVRTDFYFTVIFCSILAPPAWLQFFSFFPSYCKGAAAHSVPGCHIYTFILYMGYCPKFRPLLALHICSYSNTSAVLAEALCGCYMCHRTKQLTSKDEGEERK